MFKKLVKTTLAAAAILLGASATNASVLTLSLTSNGTGTGPIEVISENGTSWTKVPPAVLKLPVKVTVGSTVLDLDTYLIRQNGTTIGTWIDAVDGPGVKEVTHLLTGTTLLFTSEKQAIINLCNAKLNVGQGIHQEHSVWFDVPLNLYAHFYGSIANYNAIGKVSVEVICKAVSPPPPPPETADYFEFDPGPFKPTKIDLSRYTYPNDTHQQSPGSPQMPRGVCADKGYSQSGRYSQSRALQADQPRVSLHQRRCDYQRHASSRWQFFWSACSEILSE